MAKAPTISNPRILKLIELEASGRIKPEHQQELDVYRAQGVAPKGVTTTDGERKADAFLKRALGANDSYEAQKVGPRSLIGQTLADAAPDILNTLPSAVGNSPERQVSDTNQDEFIAASLRQDSGAAIPSDELAKQRRIYFPMPGESGKVLEAKRAARLRAIDGLISSAGAALSPELREKYPTYFGATPAKDDEKPGVAPGSVGGVPPASPPTADPTPPDTGQLVKVAGRELSQDAFTEESDPALAGVNARVASMIGSGRTTPEVMDYLASVGVKPDAELPGKVDKWVGFIKSNPDWKGPIGVSLDRRMVPLTTTQKIVNTGLQSEGGTFAATAVDAATGYQMRRLAPGMGEGIDELSRRNPKSALVGNVVGALGATATLEGAAGRAGLSGAGVLAPRLLAADAAYGAVAGNGINPEGGITSALTGAGLGALGGAVGRGAPVALGKTIAPTGGKLGTLYDEGVRPSPGQRFVNSGVAGKVLNATEEAMQSLPIVGYAVKGTRDRARDQFERGAFTSALREIGVDLPADVPLGTQPHKIMQEAFDVAYDKARGGMKAVSDEAFGEAFDELRNSLDNGGLTKDSIARFDKIVDDVVERRAVNGVLDGDNYKKAVSDIAKRIRAIKTNPTGDHELAGALENYTSILDEAARRHSAPEAIEALDAADRGYAKAVRIEEASKARGGDTGRFSPTQFDRAVQNGSASVRSREYLRGDALMGDYAEAGKSLVDRLPNSGTADRLLTTQALTGGVASQFLSPGTAALGGLATLPYWKGVRNATTAALAPRTSGKLRTLADVLQSDGVTRSLGVAGTPLALQYLPQQP